MRLVNASSVAGAAMIIAGAAQAQSSNTHVLTVQLPGGEVAHFEYSRDTPPQVFLDASPLRLDSSWLFPAFGPDSPFAALEQLSGELDRQAARMLEEAAAMTQNLRSDPDTLIQVNSGGHAASGHSYSFVSTMSSNGVCGRSVEITSQGAGKPPRVVTRSFGDCGVGAKAAPPGSVSVPSKQKHRPETIMASTQTGRAASAAPRDMVQQTALQH